MCRTAGAIKHRLKWCVDSSCQFLVFSLHFLACRCKGVVFYVQSFCLFVLNAVLWQLAVILFLPICLGGYCYITCWVLQEVAVFGFDKNEFCPVTHYKNDLWSVCRYPPDSLWGKSSDVWLSCCSLVRIRIPYVELTFCCTCAWAWACDACPAASRSNLRTTVRHVNLMISLSLD